MCHLLQMIVPVPNSFNEKQSERWFPFLVSLERLYGNFLFFFGLPTAVTKCRFVTRLAQRCGQHEVVQFEKSMVGSCKVLQCLPHYNAVLSIDTSNIIDPINILA